MTDQYTFRTKKGRGAVIKRRSRKTKDGTIRYEDFYTRRIFRGKEYVFKLATNARDAEKRSNEIDKFLGDPTNTIEDAFQRFNPDSAERRNKLTVADVLRAHVEIERVLEIKHSTAKNYRSQLIWCIRRVIAHRKGRKMPSPIYFDKALEEIEDFRLSGLNARFISDLKLNELSLAKSSIAEQNKAKRRLNSILSDAKSLFSETAIKEYESRGYTIPDMSAFTTATVFKRVSKKRYQLPSDDVILNIQNSLDELRGNPNSFRILLLALGAGLRKMEAIQCKQVWLIGGECPKVFIGESDDWEQKGLGESRVDLCGWAYRELMNLMESGDRVLSGTLTDGEDAARFLCAWLRQKGLDRQKPIHELRMLYGSWVANRRGIFAAQKLLRHKDAQVTSDSYADLIVRDNILQFWDDDQKDAVSG